MSPTTPTISSSLHESAHAWFNGSLLTDRWADEGFASYYGLQAAKALGIKAAADPLTDALKASRIPLNAWGAIGREDDKTEDYAYAATVVLAQAIADRAGPQALKEVWADAAGNVGAYQPPVSGGASAAGSTTPETVSGPPDWRGLLDLLEEHTGTSFDDLWRTWVARPTDLPLLDDRAGGPRGLRRGRRAGGRLAAPAARCVMRCVRGSSARRPTC